jgi:hypothetical protein
MTEAYGSQFVNQFGAEPLPAWVAGLSGLTDEQIQTGYTRAIEDNREFVPNLSVLLNYCTNMTLVSNCLTWAKGDHLRHRKTIERQSSTWLK